MSRIITLGEIMLRLSPVGHKRFVQADSLEVVYGGGEANVAVSLANYQHNVSFVTKLPNNEIGQSAIDSLRSLGVHTDNIVRGGNRIGIYYLEKGASMRPSKVIYDRAGSAIAEAKAEDFDFDSIFSGADWFHFTGITPAISKQAQSLIECALICAKKHNVTVSCDLNYRKKLWTPTEAVECMTRLMKYVDVCIGNEEDAQNCLGFVPPKNDIIGGKLNVEGYKEIFKAMHDKFGFKYIATSLRESISADVNNWSAMITNGKEYYTSRKYSINIVDRVGGGDSFSAGLIHGLASKIDFKDALEFAVAASALKHTIEGDYNLVSIQEVNALLGGDGSGRVQR